MGICLSFNDGSVPSFSKDSLCQLIEKRVGLETYISKLSEISRHEVYSRAAKHPQIRAKHSTELLLEYEFCRLFKTLEVLIGNALGAQRDLMNGLSELSLSEKENGLLLQYKELIRDQDKRLHELMAQVKSVSQEKEQLQVQMEELRQTNCQLEDQNTLLKAQLSTGVMDPVENDVAHENCSKLPQRLDADDSDVRIKGLVADNATKDEELESLKKDQEDLLQLLTYQEFKLNNFKMRLKELGEDVDDNDSDNNSDEEEEEEGNSDADVVDM